MKFFFKFIVFYFKFLLASIILFFLKIIKPFFLIKFIIIRSTQIGHLILELDYILYNKIYKNDKKTLYIFCITEPVANNFIYKKYKKHFLMSKNCLYIYNFLFPAIKKLSKIKYEFFDNARFNPLMDIGYHCLKTNNYNKILVQSISELKKEKKILKHFNLKNENFVCFNVRDNYYYNNNDIINKYSLEKKILNYDIFNFRNSKIENMYKSIDFLIKKNYKVVRIGKGSEKKLDIKNENFIDYTFNDLNNDENDIFLLKNCKFFIGTRSGITLIPLLYNKPILWINSTWEGVQFNNNVNDIILPKKLWSINEKRFLNFYEMRQLGAPFNNSGESYKINNIEVIENDEEEIYNAVNEMILKLKNEWKDDLETQELKNKYLKLLWRDFDDKNILCNYPLISSTFIKKNKFLLTKKNKSKIIIPFIHNNLNESSKYYFYNKIIKFIPKKDDNNNVKIFRYLVNKHLHKVKFIKKYNGINFNKSKNIHFRFLIFSIVESSIFYLNIEFKNTFFHKKKFILSFIFNETIYYEENITIYNQKNKYYFYIPSFITKNYQYFNIEINIQSFFSIKNIIIKEMCLSSINKNKNINYKSYYSIFNPKNNNILKHTCDFF